MTRRRSGVGRAAVAEDGGVRRPLPEPATGTDCSSSTTSVNHRGPPSMSRRVGYPWPEQMARKMLRNVEKTRSSQQPETVRACRPPLPGARWPSRSLARRIALVQGNARQGPPTLRHQCQLVQDPLSLELNRRLVVKSRLSEIFSDVNASVGPPHFFVISSNLTTINTRTIGSVLTLHRHFHLSPLDPLARKRKRARKGPLALWHKVNGGGRKQGRSCY